MVASQFYTHASQISAAIVAAIEVYCTKAGIPWDSAAFEEESPHDVEQMGKDALFYGSEVFPDAPDVAR